ncbi:MAG TPA: type II secretion system F family protein [Gemmatimonadales bacterium]|nr:type II secretion system F family protein [Gemmatimonadales bacterium]
MPGTTLLTAALVFVAVALGTLSLALLLEWGQERWRARSVVRKLREFSEQAFGADNQSVLRRTAAATWLERMAATTPRFAGLASMLQESGTTTTLQSFLLASTGLAVGLGLFGLLVTRSWIGGLILAPIGAALPYVVYRIRANHRRAKLEEQLPDAVDLMARAMRAGHPLSAGFKMVAEEGPAPIALEFRQVFEEQRFGLPFEDSLLGLAARIRLTDVRILVTAILVQHQVGGNLAEILDNIGNLVRERFKLRRQLRVITAQGRISGLVLTFLPVTLGVAIAIVNPEYLAPILQEPAGRLMIAAAALLQVLGYLWIRQILDIEF